MADDAGMSDSQSGGDAGSSSNGGSSSKTSKKKKEKSKFAGALQDVGRKMNESATDALRDQARDAADRITSFKRGGTKRGKGLARLHKRETVMAPKKSKRKRGRMSGRM